MSTADALLAASRAVHFAAVVQLAGLLAFLVLIAPGPARRLCLLAGASLALALVSDGAWLWAEAATMSGRPLAAAADPAILGTVLGATRFGRVFAIRLALAALLAILLPAIRAHRRARLAALLAASGLLGSLAWTGHGAAGEGAGGALHLAANILHLLAAGAWLGGLVPLALFLAWARRAEDRAAMTAARSATRRFSTLGLLSVGSLLATGIVNTWFLAGTPPALLGTRYGQLLLVKIGLFLAMVGMAAVNRLRLTPLLLPAPRGGRRGTARDALRRLRRNSLVEAALGLAVIAIVGALGTLVPGLHQRPRWPLPFRLDAEALAAPQGHLAALLATASAMTGLAVAAALLRRRAWWSLPLAGLALAIAVVPGLGLFAVKAYPTSFYLSPTGYTARSIAEGGRLFAADCALCHGGGGRGDGPAAKSLPIPPADLTAPHIHAHPDGDLFWWISHGIAGTPMPGFAASLDEEARWSLIDFVHANADAAQIKAASGPLTAPVRAPGFTAGCPDGTTLALADLRGRLVRLVLAAADAMPRGLKDGDVVTIAVPDGAPAAALAPFCTAADPAVRAAYALFGGTELIIGPAGLLRAVRHPGADAGWRDATAFREMLAEIRRTPAELPRPGGHAHPD